MSMLLRTDRRKVQSVEEPEIVRDSQRRDREKHYEARRAPRHAYRTGSITMQLS